MKFLCSHCKAKYQIADEKVAGRSLRMTCRNCQQEIVITGAPATQSSPARRQISTPAPSALGADFQRQLGASPHAPAPVMAPIDEWHVAVNDSPVGPMGRDEVARMLVAGTINSETLAWREGLDDWLPVRRIPELAMFGAGSPSHPAPSFRQPAQRAEMAPIGGRGGAAAAYAMEDWGTFAEPTGSSSQVSVSPLADPGAERRGPSWPAMFALAGGFAFLMSALAILGARWLQAPPSAPAAAPVAVAPAAAPQAQGAQAQVVEIDDPNNDMVIELDDPELATGRRSGGRPRSVPTSKSGKPLSAAEQEMLARMGGDTGSTIAGVRPNSGSLDSARPKQGGLTSDQLSQVVMRGRKNLQRCYETALRGSGSRETVRMDVSVTVSAAGNVTLARAAGQGLPGMGDCIERTVRMWRFPGAGESTQTKFPVVFQPGA